MSFICEKYFCIWFIQYKPPLRETGYKEFVRWAPENSYIPLIVPGYKENPDSRVRKFRAPPILLLTVCIVYWRLHFYPVVLIIITDSLLFFIPKLFRIKVLDVLFDLIQKFFHFWMNSKILAKATAFENNYFFRSIKLVYFALTIEMVLKIKDKKYKAIKNKVFYFTLDPIRLCSGNNKSIFSNISRILKRLIARVDCDSALNCFFIIFRLIFI